MKPCVRQEALSKGMESCKNCSAALTADILMRLDYISRMLWDAIASFALVAFRRRTVLVTIAVIK